MSFRSLRDNQSGFSVVELLIALSLAVLISIMFFTLFKTNTVQYLNLQKDANTATTLAAQEARIANVLRGVTGVVSAADNDLVAYSYFYPSDTYVSQIHYYLSGGNLMADVTPMSSNPPVGLPITASRRTYTIIPGFYQVTGTPLFVYFDSNNTTLVSPVSDVTGIKSIKINLAAKNSTGGNQTMNLQVTLRNEKTNL
jgi:type II secretory pathway pseudopilin PulG